MAASSKLKKLNVSLAISSSASSVETETSSHEYTEDFRSSLHSSFEEIFIKLPEISKDCSANVDVNVDECIAQFAGRKIQVLKQNRVFTTEKLTVDRKSIQNQRELSPYWVKKLEALRLRNTNNQTRKYNEQHLNLYELHGKSDDKSRSKNSKAETKGNEIGAFQSAYERIKFENLRERCRTFVKHEIHSSETCSKCSKMQDNLIKNKFYINCVRKIKQNIVEEKLAENIESTSSALLIAKIIKDGPKPSWTKDEIWDKLLLGGYQHSQS